MPTSPTPARPRGATRLEEWGLIHAKGAEARQFLHGQLTQDVEGLTDDGARLAGYCSAKGRLLATFVIWSQGTDEVLLVCSADLLPVVLKRLSMFVLRAKCKLRDASADLPLWGIADDPAMATLQPWQRKRQPAGELIRLPDAAPAQFGTVARYLFIGNQAPDLPALDAETWRWLEVQSGVARVTAATTEQFVPQMINLELVGGVNFGKGCYPGQEIVARSQYRGTLKRRACLVEGAQAMRPGEELFDSADPGQPAGMVVLSAGAPQGGYSALAELKLAAQGGGRLHAGSPEGPLLSLSTLPYALPA